MNYKLLDEKYLKSLRVFCAAVEAGGFAAAEKNLNLSKASISRHIKDVEDALDAKLCSRGPSGFKLTAAGITALNQAQKALDAFAKIKPEVDNVKGTLSGNLNIGIVEKIFKEENFNLALALRKFKLKAPNVTPNLRVMTFSQLNQAIRDRSVDIAIRGRYEDDAFLNFYPLFYEYHKLYVHQDSMADHKNLPLIYRTHPFIYELLTTHHYKKGPTASGLEAVTCLIETGQYIGMLPESYAEKILTITHIKEVPESPVFTNTICAIVEKYRPLSASIEAFLDLLVNP